MKSYSNDIPNISSDEMKRNVEVNDQTNQLVKENLNAILDHNIAENNNFNQVKSRLDFILILLFILIGITGVSLALSVLPLFNSMAN